MEMTGLLQALRAIKKPGQTIEVFCDSSYLMDCFRQKWYERWVKNGWMTSSKKPVENRELWEALLPFLDEHDISFYRVKGHVNVDWHMGLTKRKAKLIFLQTMIRSQPFQNLPMRSVSPMTICGRLTVNSANGTETSSCLNSSFI